MPKRRKPAKPSEPARGRGRPEERIVLTPEQAEGVLGRWLSKPGPNAEPPPKGRSVRSKRDAPPSTPG
jgi:hypothetical protein